MSQDRVRRGERTWVRITPDQGTVSPVEKKKKNYYVLNI